MNSRANETMLHPFLYTFIMDIVQLQQKEYPSYAQTEPGFAEAYFQAYIAAFKSPRDGKISHDLLKKINHLSMQHIAKTGGQYRINSIQFKLSREIYELPNGDTGENITYSSTETGLNEFVTHWFLNQAPSDHALIFQKDGEKIQCHLKSVNGQICMHDKDLNRSLLPNNQASILLKKWFHSDYRCSIRVDADAHTDITSKMQEILEGYHREISLAISDADKISIIAKYIQWINQLHPFPDGNIRTCSILLNKLLSDFDLPLTILLNPNRLDCCDLNEIVRSIQEGQIIYQHLLNNRDPRQFVFPLGKPLLDNIHEISAKPYDLQMPDLVQSFCAWVLNRPRAGFLTQFQQGFFTLPRQIFISALRQSIDPDIATLTAHQAQALISNIFETENFSLLLRRACLIGQYEIIKKIVSFQLSLAIDVNEPSKKGGTALDYLERHPSSVTKHETVRLLYFHGAQTQTQLDDQTLMPDSATLNLRSRF